MRNGCEARAGFRHPVQTRVPTRCQRGRWARSRQALLVVYVLQHQLVEPGSAVHCCCDVVSCAIRTKLKLRRSVGFLALTSDLPQQRSNIMMHPSSHLAARRQRCSHAPIPPRHPRLVFTSTWSLSRARYVRECCVPLLSIMRVNNLSSYDHFIQKFIDRKTVRG